MRRLCAFVLLLLSASPLTAPFSVTGVQDLFDSPSATIQAKKAPDEPLVALGSAPGLAAVVLSPLRTLAPAVDSHPRVRSVHVTPLRL